MCEKRQITKRELICRCWRRNWLTRIPILISFFFVGHVSNSEHRHISGYMCLFAVDGFSRAKIQPRFPPLSLVRTPSASPLAHSAALASPAFILFTCLFLCLDQWLTPAFTTAGERAEGVCTWEHGGSRYPLARLAGLSLIWGEEGARPDLRLSQDH
jgi:hypothetical protein